MARILFTILPGTGHLHPLAPLALALQAAGHEIRVATARSFAPAVTVAVLVHGGAGKSGRP